MEKEIYMTGERKVGREWVQDCKHTDREYIYRQLANVLSARYINRAKWVSRVSHKCNYDGTYTYTIYYGNGYRNIIRADF